MRMQPTAKRSTAHNNSTAQLTSMHDVHAALQRNRRDVFVHTRHAQPSVRPTEQQKMRNYRHASMHTVEQPYILGSQQMQQHIEPYRKLQHRNATNNV